MSVVTISCRYQIVIPRDVRERLGLRPGQQLRAIALDGRVALIPLDPIEATRGFARGVDATVAREGDRV